MISIINTFREFSTKNFFHNLSILFQNKHEEAKKNCRIQKGTQNDNDDNEDKAKKKKKKKKK